MLNNLQLANANVINNVFVRSKMQSYMDVVSIIAAGFNQYLEQQDKAYRQVLTPIQSNEYILNELGSNVVITYSVERKQPGSQKFPLSERTFLSPVYVNSEAQPSGLQYQNTFKYFIDVLIQFDLYARDYKLLQLQCEDFVEYMSLVKLVPNEFWSRGFKIPTFWEQLRDEAINIGSTIVYHGRLLFVTQLVQTIENYEHIIRQVNIFVKMQE